MASWFVDASVLLASEDAEDVNHEDSVLLLRAEGTITTLDLAYYEVSNVAVRAWHDEPAAHRLREKVDTVAGDGGLVRADSARVADAIVLAGEQGISVYDAAYAAAAIQAGSELVSCDVRDLVSRRLAVLPSTAREAEARVDNAGGGEQQPGDAFKRLG
ncbi:MAG: PIN domain-containing protein [Acidimicrobiales bacterium]